MNIEQHPVTPANYTKGRSYQGKPVVPDVIVIHVAVTTLQGCFNVFNNPAEEKSSHYCVGEAGEIWQFVQEADNAWHAGKYLNPRAKLVVSRLPQNPNSYCVGIENSGEYPGDHTPNDFTDAQYEANGWLVSEIAKRWNIPLDLDHVIPHNQIRSDKTCPGTKVSMQRILDIARKYSSPSSNKEKILAHLDEIKKLL